jgi:hypothetical protein
MPVLFISLDITKKVTTVNATNKRQFQSCTRIQTEYVSSEWYSKPSCGPLKAEESIPKGSGGANFTGEMQFDISQKKKKTANCLVNSDAETVSCGRSNYTHMDVHTSRPGGTIGEEED